MRYLIDRGIRGAARDPRRRGRDVPGLGVVFDDPEVAPADWTPRLRVLSLDIETDPPARRLLAIGLHGCGVSEVLLLTPAGLELPGGRAAVRVRARAAGRRSRGACASWIPTCSPAGTSWTSTCPVLARARRAAARPAGARPRRRGRCACAPRARRAARPRPASRAAWCSTASSSCAAPSSAWTTTGSTRWRARCWARARRSTRRRTRPDEILRLFQEDRAAVRRVQPHRRAARARDPGAAAAGRAGGRAQPAHRPAARPRRPARSPPSTSCYLTELGRRRRRRPERPRGRGGREPQEGGHVLEPRPRPLRATSWCSTSRACTRA